MDFFSQIPTIETRQQTNGVNKHSNYDEYLTVVLLLKDNYHP